MSSFVVLQGEGFLMKMKFILFCVFFSVSAQAKQTATMELDLSESIGPTMKRFLVDGGAEKRADRCWSEYSVDYAGPKGERIVSYKSEQKDSISKNAKPKIEIDPGSVNRDRRLLVRQRCD
jgi:hypothetical protein